VNDIPVAADQAVTTDEDAPVAIVLGASDADGSQLIYAIVTGPTNGTLSGTAPNLTYTPAANFSGADSFTFSVNDGTAGSNVATVSISVTDVEHAPVAADQAVTTNEDTPVAITLGASDADGSAPTYTVVAGPANGTLRGTAPNLTYTPAANFSGADSFTFSVNDGSADSNVATVSITVTEVNDTPVAADQAVTTNEDAPVAIMLGASDADGSALTYTIVTGPANGTLSGTAPSLTYTPAANFSGADGFTFSVNDGSAESNVATVSITVTEVSDTPVAADQAVTTNEDTPVAITLDASDADGSALTYTIVTGPASGTLSGTAPSLTYTPAANVSGADSFTFVANDGSADSNVATVSITVTEVSDTPVAADQAVTTNEDTPVAITLGASDADGSALTYTIVTGPANGTLSGTAPNLSYTPNVNFSGADSFTFSVNDGSTESSVATVSITFTEVNDIPVATDQAVTTNEDTPVAITLGASDADGAAPTYTIVSGPTNGTLSGTAPNLTYTPAANFSGADSFTFSVNDGSADSNVATVSLTVSQVNDAPGANSQAITINEDTARTITLTGTDAEGATLAFQIATPPAHGTLTGTAPNLTYTPAANYNGSDSFSFTTNDGSATSAAATVSITIAGVNDAPAFTKGANATANENSGPQSIAGWATGISAGPADESGQTVQFLISNDNAALFSAQPTVDASGTLTFTPAGGLTGVANITVRLRDSGGTASGGVDTSAAQTFTISVIVEVIPELSIADASVYEGNSGSTPLVFAVTLSAPRTTPVTVHYTTMNGTASSRDFQSASGTLTFAPGEVTKSITVIVSGDTQRENTETLGVRLSNAVGAPIVDSDALGLILDDESMATNLSKVDGVVSIDSTDFTWSENNWSKYYRTGSSGRGSGKDENQHESDNKGRGSDKDDKDDDSSSGKDSRSGKDDKERARGKKGKG
jgi:hypothetical protein